MNCEITTGTNEKMKGYFYTWSLLLTFVEGVSSVCKCSLMGKPSGCLLYHSGYIKITFIYLFLLMSREREERGWWKKMTRENKVSANCDRLGLWDMLL